MASELLAGASRPQCPTGCDYAGCDVARRTLLGASRSATQLTPTPRTRQPKGAFSP